MNRFFQRNIRVKLVSLLFAILFWLFVMNQGSTGNLTGEQTRTIPLVAIGLPQNMVLMTDLPSVSVRFLGINPSANIKDLYAQVDLTGAVAGEFSYDISVNKPTGTTVLDVQPASIKLKLDTIEEKTVPVEAIISGEPLEGYQLGTPIIKPSAVNVRGPSTLLSTVEKVVVEINATGVKDNIQLARPVSFRDKENKPVFGPSQSVDILSASPSSVDVMVPVILKQLSTKMIPLKVTSQGNPAKGKVLRSLLPSPASVQVMGTTEALKGFDSLTIGPVDLTDLAEDKVFQISNDKVTLPEGISFASGTSLSVIAQIGSELVQQGITGVPVQIRNIGAGIVVDKPISAINITVEGFPETIKNVTLAQIELWVDATGQGVGSYNNIKVFWQLPPGVTMPTIPQVSYNLKV